MHFLITGHTGFKGSWLTAWLANSGHRISGISNDPKQNALFARARVEKLMSHDIREDIRDASLIKDALNRIQPDVVIHMAAQPLVRESYRNPRLTMETNVMGTFNVLSAVQSSDSVQAQLVITTDKVYRNLHQKVGYVESDPLGGEDPYSASKAMADILTRSLVRSFGGPPTAIARAGNVLGGGDIGNERLLPDLMAAALSGEEPVLRFPDAVRPWQHVLDCLNGYMMLLALMIEAEEPVSDWGAWNFGPGDDNLVTVREIAARVADLWGVEQALGSARPVLREAELLNLDTRKARSELEWSNVLSLDQALEWTVDWTRRAQRGEDPLKLMSDQISRFEDLRDLSE